MIAKRPVTRAAVDVEALINRGGQPANGNGHKAHITPKGTLKISTGTTGVILRIPDATLAAIDADVKSRRVKTPRHTWLLEAIEEKLLRRR